MKARYSSVSEAKILTALFFYEKYGYEISKETGVPIGGLYTILHRLTKSKFLITWKRSNANGDKGSHSECQIYYRITPSGKVQLKTTLKAFVVLTKKLCEE